MSTSDDALLRRAEEALTQIDREQGLSDYHAEVLAALRIRIFGAPKKTLDDALKAAGDLKGKTSLTDVKIPEREESLEDVLKQPPKKKRSLDDLL
jgi:hypothetical protein